MVDSGNDLVIGMVCGLLYIVVDELNMSWCIFVCVMVVYSVISLFILLL